MTAVEKSIMTRISSKKSGISAALMIEVIKIVTNIIKTNQIYLL